MRLKYTLLAAVLLTGAAPAPQIKLWRLDCGDFDISDFGSLSDIGSYDGMRRQGVGSCYLIQHNDTYMLWDTGIDAGVKDKPVNAGVFGLTLKATLIEQLAKLGLSPDRISMIGISHHHYDHIGQARAFPKATLLIGAADLAALKQTPPPADAAALAPWLTGGAPVKPVTGDLDVFGDKSVIMQNMPGHTPGHMSLLVRLPKASPVMLTGDLFHATPSYENDEVPDFNTSRAETLASMDRFKKIAAHLHAKVIIQHEVADVGKLPAFPTPAE